MRLPTSAACNLLLPQKPTCLPCVLQAHLPPIASPRGRFFCHLAETKKLISGKNVLLCSFSKFDVCFCPKVSVAGRVLLMLGVLFALLHKRKLNSLRGTVGKNKALSSNLLGELFDNFILQFELVSKYWVI